MIWGIHFPAVSVCSIQIWSEVYSVGLPQRAKYCHATVLLVGGGDFPILCQNLKS